jgi:hypothetical protein
MDLDGVAIRTENTQPYALFGDAGGDLRGGLHIGEHQVKFDFFALDNAKGTHLASEVISFTLADGSSSNPAPLPAPDGGSASPLVRYFLADADTNKVLVELRDGQTVNPQLYQKHDLTIVAQTAEGSHIQSIKMNLDNGAAIRVENSSPYSLFGDTNGDLRGGLREGQHEIKFDFYDADHAKGNHLGTDSLTITIDDPLLV